MPAWHGSRSSTPQSTESWSAAFSQSLLLDNYMLWRHTESRRHCRNTCATNHSHIYPRVDVSRLRLLLAVELICFARTNLCTNKQSFRNVSIVNREGIWSSIFNIILALPNFQHIFSCTNQQNFMFIAPLLKKFIYWQMCLKLQIIMLQFLHWKVIWRT